MDFTSGASDGISKRHTKLGPLLVVMWDVVWEEDNVRPAREGGVPKGIRAPASLAIDIAGLVGRWSTVYEINFFILFVPVEFDDVRIIGVKCFHFRKCRDLNTIF